MKVQCNKQAVMNIMQLENSQLCAPSSASKRCLLGQKSEVLLNLKSHNLSLSLCN